MFHGRGALFGFCAENRGFGCVLEAVEWIIRGGFLWFEA